MPIGCSGATNRSAAKGRHRDGPDRRGRAIVREILNEGLSKVGYVSSKFMPGLCIRVDVKTADPFTCSFGSSYMITSDVYLLRLAGINIYGMGWVNRQHYVYKIASVADPEFTNKVVHHVCTAHRELLSKRLNKHNKYVEYLNKAKQDIESQMNNI